MTTNQHQEVPPMTPDTEQKPSTAAPATVRAPGSRPSPRPRSTESARTQRVVSKSDSAHAGELGRDEGAGQGHPGSEGRPMTNNSVTESNSTLSSGDLEDSAAERDSAWKVSTLYQGLHWDLATFSDWIEKAGKRSRAYWMPPRFLTQPPASIAEMTAYAHRGGWTNRTTGLLRALGSGWFHAVALPVTVVTRWVGWITERPGRGLLGLVVWQLFIRTGGGPWIAAHVIEPVLAALAWLLLP